MKILVGFFITTLLCLAQTPLILTTHDLSPYGFYNKDKTFDGIAVKPIQYALEQMNWPYEIRVMPWQRAQLLVQQDKAHGFFAGSHNKKRDSYAVMSEVIADQRWNWYWLKEKQLNPFSKTFKQKAKVSSFNGANMQKWLQKNNYNVAAFPHNTEHALELLLAHRFDALLANNHVMRQLIQQKGLRNQLRIKTQKHKPLGVYFSKTFLQKNPKFLKEFNKHIREYKKMHGLSF